MLLENMTHLNGARLVEQLIDPDRNLTAAEKRLTEHVLADVVDIPMPD